MSLAYFSTWTTYGTWLPGDSRGWFIPGKGFAGSEPRRELLASLSMTESAIVLDFTQRSSVEQTISDHCRIRRWTLHAAQCRTNHVHVVLSVSGELIERQREQFKAWATRKLKASFPGRDQWWTERGWDLYLDDEQSLYDATRYVLEGQNYPSC